MNNQIDHVRISLRLPSALHTRLQAQARHQRRSLHGQIVWLLDHLASVPEAVGSSPGVLPSVVDF
jgi:hypothetical protein